MVEAENTGCLDEYVAGIDNGYQACMMKPTEILAKPATTKPSNEIVWAWTFVLSY